MSGLLIAIEGADHAGTSTQSVNVAKELQQKGYTVKVFKFLEKESPVSKVLTHLQFIGQKISISSLFLFLSSFVSKQPLDLAPANTTCSSDR